jgi:GNAT superfamily N-acetyltransferase
MTGDAGLVVRVADLAEVRALQQAVLRPSGPLPTDRPAPGGTIAVGAFDGAEAVGTACVNPAPWPGPGTVAEPAWQLRSMAVRADRRSAGIGRRVLDQAVDTAREHGAATLWADARVAALPFYVRAGWTVVGDQWEKPRVGPHRWIVLAP